MATGGVPVVGAGVGDATGAVTGAGGVTPPVAGLPGGVVPPVAGLAGGTGDGVATGFGLGAGAGFVTAGGGTTGVGVTTGAGVATGVGLTAGGGVTTGAGVATGAGVTTGAGLTTGSGATTGAATATGAATTTGAAMGAAVVTGAGVTAGAGAGVATGWTVRADAWVSVVASRACPVSPCRPWPDVAGSCCARWLADGVSWSVLPPPPHALSSREENPRARAWAMCVLRMVERSGKSGEEESSIDVVRSGA